MKKPFFSIILPYYNCEYINNAILSVYKQTCWDFELIIINDCSTRNVKIDTSILNQLPSVEFINNPSNIGAGASRNIGISKARGRFVAFLDSDDIWYENKLQCQKEFLIQTSYSFIYSYYEESDKFGNRKLLLAPSRVTKLKLAFCCYIGCLTVVVESELAKKVKFKSLICRNDYMYWLDLLNFTKFAYLLPISLAQYNRRFVGLSSSQTRNIIYYYKVIKIAFDSALIPIITFPFYFLLVLLKRYNANLYNKIAKNI